MWEVLTGGWGWKLIFDEFILAVTVGIRAILPCETLNCVVMLLCYIININVIDRYYEIKIQIFNFI